MDNQNWDYAFPKPPRHFHEKLACTLAQLPENKENDVMGKNIKKSRLSLKKCAVIGVAAVLLLGTTAFAGGKVSSWMSGSSSIPSFTTLPSQEDIQAEYGFAPKMLEEFENGYVFHSGHSTDTEGYDENENIVASFKQLDLQYRNGSKKIHISSNTYPITEEESDFMNLVKHGYKDITIYESSYTSKCVPVDYVMTEDDKQKEADGTYVFSYGSDEVTISEPHFFQWSQDGISYMIMVMDNDIPSEDLLYMAYELIDME